MKRIFQIICGLTIVLSILFTAYGSIKLAQASKAPVMANVINPETGNIEFVAKIPYATTSVENSRKIVTISLVTLVASALGMVGTLKNDPVSEINSSK